MINVYLYLVKQYFINLLRINILIHFIHLNYS